MMNWVTIIILLILSISNIACFLLGARVGGQKEFVELPSLGSDEVTKPPDFMGEKDIDEYADTEAFTY